MYNRTINRYERYLAPYKFHFASQHRKFAKRVYLYNLQMFNLLYIEYQLLPGDTHNIFYYVKHIVLSIYVLVYNMRFTSLPPWI